MYVELVYQTAACLGYQGYDPSTHRQWIVTQIGARVVDRVRETPVLTAGKRGGGGVGRRSIKIVGGEGVTALAPVKQDNKSQPG